MGRCAPGAAAPAAPAGPRPRAPPRPAARPPRGLKPGERHRSQPPLAYLQRAQPPWAVLRQVGGAVAGGGGARGAKSLIRAARGAGRWSRVRTPMAVRAPSRGRRRQPAQAQARGMRAAAPAAQHACGRAPTLRWRAPADAALASGNAASCCSPPAPVCLCCCGGAPGTCAPPDWVQAVEVGAPARCTRALRPPHICSARLRLHPSQHCTACMRTARLGTRAVAWSAHCGVSAGV